MTTSPVQALVPSSVMAPLPPHLYKEDPALLFFYYMIRPDMPQNTAAP